MPRHALSYMALHRAGVLCDYMSRIIEIASNDEALRADFAEYKAPDQGEPTHSSIAASSMRRSS